MAEHETTDDIIAEKRFDATTRDQFDSSYIVDFCDRLEAAHKREAVTDCNQFGDAAKLREALKYMFMLIDGRHLVLECETTEEISGVQGKLAEARVALSAPPRNCDRPECASTTAAQAVWHKEDGGRTAYYEWLLAPATEKEGGDNGNE